MTADNYTLELSKVYDYCLTCISTHDIPLIRHIGKHIFTNKGKGLRPYLALITSTGASTPIRIQLAACIELIHTASLLHDDVIDESDTRRDQQTTHTKWGTTSAILMGDFFFAQAFAMMTKFNDICIADALAEKASSITQGELLQLENQGNFELSLDVYLDIIQKKTASLFEVACTTGALLAHKNPTPYTTVGRHIGALYQMLDDIAEYSLLDNMTKASDFFEKKMTLPLIVARDAASNTEKSALEQAFHDGDISSAFPLIKKYEPLVHSHTKKIINDIHAHIKTLPLHEKEFHHFLQLLPLQQ